MDGRRTTGQREDRPRTVGWIVAPALPTLTAVTERRRGRKEHGPNPDPVTSASGAHPIGTASGAAGFGMAATAIGGVFAGPFGALLGAAIGAVAGGLIGKGAAELVNPTVEDEHWRRHYRERGYVRPGDTYERYQAAYQFGWEAGRVCGAKRWREVEPELAAVWPAAAAQAGVPDLGWGIARSAARDAWDRVCRRRRRRQARDRRAAGDAGRTPRRAAGSR